MIIDLSHYQSDAGRIDYAQVRSAVTGAYIKLTEGVDYIDPAWRAHAIGLKGIPRGGYHFCRGGDPSGEVHHFADVLATGTWELRPAIDIEWPQASAGWLREFIAALRAATGVRALRVYSSFALLRDVLEPGQWIDPELDIWAARYNDTLGWDHPQLALWQYTQSGRIPGITGPVDQSMEVHGWTPNTDQVTGGDDVLADERAALMEVRDNLRLTKPGVRLPGRGAVMPALTDDQYGWVLNSAGKAADALAAVQQLRADLAAGKLGIDYAALAKALLAEMAKP